MLNVVDLFAGAGGLTFGFYYRTRNNKFERNPHFNILFANEYDHSAAEAFRSNFPDIPMLECDIASINKKILEDNKILYSDVDIVIGGPPCQSFSYVGKRQYDQRARMYKEYIRLLEILHPKMFIFENVTGLLSMKNTYGKPVIEDVRNMFMNIMGPNSVGYEIHQKVLNAKDFGVPQNRERVFIIGISKTSKLDWNFPSPDFGEGKKEYRTLDEAISDLPILGYGEEKIYYESNYKNDYQELMRKDWYSLMDHFSGKYGEKIYKILSILPEGESRQYINDLVDRGEIDQKYYLSSGYHNTYGRLWRDRPCTTITNSLGTPSSLRCIHPTQARALTTREGARIQSFPDWFKFHGTKKEKNSQVGNAVPPLLAIKLAKQALKIFSE